MRLRLVEIAFALVVATVSLTVGAQEIAVAVTRVNVDGLPRGQFVFDLTTLTRHPAYLEPQSLKTPDGIRIIASAVSPENARTCPRAGPSQAECRQVFRVTLDTGARCQASGNYEALFRIACWPGTAASLCKPGAYQHDFKLGAEARC